MDWMMEETRERSRARSRDANGIMGPIAPLWPAQRTFNSNHNDNDNDNDSALELLSLTISCIGNTLLLT
jgi:hypothetical protein